MSVSAGEMLREMAAQEFGEFRADLDSFQDCELEKMIDGRIAALQSDFAKYRRLKKREIRNVKRAVKV